VSGGMGKVDGYVGKKNEEVGYGKSIQISFLV
jgi:hypothetical protein